MSGAGPISPDLAGMRILLEGARHLEGTLGATLELSVLTLCLPSEVVAIDIEKIDWARGTVGVPARGRRHRTLALASASLQAILRICGSAGGVGQVVTGGRGRRLAGRDIRLDRIQDRLAEAWPPSSAIDWNFRGLRAAGANLLWENGVHRSDIVALLFGRPDRMEILHDHSSVEAARSAAERWCELVLGTPARRDQRQARIRSDA